MRSLWIRGLFLMVLAAAGSAGAPAQTPSDQEVLQRQRELLLQRRQETQRTRTLLEINPSTGTTEQPAAASSGGTAVLSTEPEPQSVQEPTAEPPRSREEIATASVPAMLEPEDQLFRPINFAYDSAFLDQTARQILDGLCATLQADLGANPGSSYFVIGHTDAAGSDEYNQRLSLRRAESTKQYLVDGCGIASAQLKPVGMGEQRLLASAGPRASDQRRVEIQVRTSGEDG